MYDSGITVDAFIEDVKSEADIAPDISDSKYLLWINSLEQILYSDVIKEQKEYRCFITDGTFEIVPIKRSGEAQVCPEDVLAVFYGEKHLKKTTLLSAAVFDYCWYIKDGKLYFKTEDGCDNKEEIKVIYHVRPEIKTAVGGEEPLNIMLPLEFMDLIYSYVRAEAYKFANEDALCAKWQAEYNARVDIFREWIESRRSNFGL